MPHSALGKILCCLAVALAAVPFAVAVRAADVPDAAINSIFQPYNKSDVPGCEIGVERAGAAPVLHSYGSADLEHDVPITPDTVFEAGSVSKQFTAASVLILVERGKIAFGDDIRKFLPEMPDYGAPITIAQLLGHTSGLRDWGDVEDMAGWARTSRVYTLKDTLEIAARQKALNYAQGSAYSYTNTGYNLLAIIVQRVSGEPLPQFSQEHLFKPLGMTHTQWRDDFRRIVKGRAVAYDADADGYHQLMPFENAYGNGGLLTTVGDLLKWNDALDSGALGKFVTAELQRQSTLNDGTTIRYARGLDIETYRGVREVSHDGATAGYRSALMRYPDQRLSIALLCNRADADPGSLAHKVADIYLPPPPLDIILAPALTLTPAQLAPLAGTYFNERVGKPLQISVKDGALRWKNDAILVARAPDEFTQGGSTVHFVGTDRIKVQTAGGDALEFRRIQPWQPSAAELAAFAGRYTSDEALATYEVTVADGHLMVAVVERRWDKTAFDPVARDIFALPYNSIHFLRDSHHRIAGLDISTPRVYALRFRKL